MGFPVSRLPKRGACTTPVPSRPGAWVTIAIWLLGVSGGAADDRFELLVGAEGLVSRTTRLVEGRTTRFAPFSGSVLGPSHRERHLNVSLRGATATLELRYRWSKWGVRLTVRGGGGQSALRLRRRDRGCLCAGLERVHLDDGAAWTAGGGVGPFVQCAVRPSHLPFVGTWWRSSDSRAWSVRSRTVCSGCRELFISCVSISPSRSRCPRSPARFCSWSPRRWASPSTSSNTAVRPMGSPWGSPSTHWGSADATTHMTGSAHTDRAGALDSGVLSSRSESGSRAPVIADGGSRSMRRRVDRHRRRWRTGRRSAPRRSGRRTDRPAGPTGRRG